MKVELKLSTNRGITLIEVGQSYRLHLTDGRVFTRSLVTKFRDDSIYIRLYYEDLTTLSDAELQILISDISDITPYGA